MTNIEQIQEKAAECLNCPTKPCQKGCPLNNDIPQFIEFINKKEYKKAYETLSNTTVLPAICGRVCPHTKQCQGNCVKRIKFTPVEIGKLEAFIGDLAIQNNWKIQALKETNHKVCVIGGGPAGLTCAAFLRKNGIGVTIYEKQDYLGGILMHGIPKFRLSKDVVEKTIQKIIDMGIEVKLNQEFGKDYTLPELKEKYDAIFLSFGANISNKTNIPGEDLKGVFGGNELLESNINIDCKNKTIVVSGGGNVAMDVARTYKRLGASEVIVVYRRSEKEMPAENKEVKQAKEEGIKFLFQNNIIAIYGENKVEKIELVKTELVQKEGENRPSPVNIKGSNYYIDCDYVIMAVGSHSEENIVQNLGLELDKKGNIIIDEFGHTSDEKVFAGGEIAGTKGTVAWAARSGRDASNAIISFLAD